MPQLDVVADQYTGSSQLSMLPADGDLREYCGNIEKFQYGNWVVIGTADITILENNIFTLENEVARLMIFKKHIEAREEIFNEELEQQFPELLEVGGYLQKAREMVTHMEQVYVQMEEHTKAKLKTFDTINDSVAMKPNIKVMI